MSTKFIGLSPEEIEDRIREAASAVARGPVMVRVGAERELIGMRNVGVDLPRACPGSGEAPSVRRRRVARTLEQAGVSLAVCALAEQVQGQLLGSVQVREITRRVDLPQDASHFARPRDGDPLAPKGHDGVRP